MSESITILINAEDQASAKLTKVGNSAEALGTRVRESGRSIKSTTELAGTFANALGDTAFGGFAGQMAQATERVGAFSEVAKAGTAGAIAFRAGLVGLAAVAGFKLGEAIGNAVFQTEEWRKKLLETASAAEKLNGMIARTQMQQSANFMNEFNAMSDPGERQAAIAERLKALGKESEGVTGQIQKLNKELKATEGGGFDITRPITSGANFVRGQQQAELRKGLEQDLAAAAQRKQALEDEMQELRQITGERARELEATKAANAAKEKSQSFIDGLREEITLLKATKEERLAIEAAKNTTPEQTGAAQALLAEREALKAKAEAEKEAQKQADDARRAEIAAAEKVQDLQKKELAKLQEKQILLTQGAEAARAFALQQQGLTEQAALAIAKEEARLSEKQTANSFEADRQPLQAFESRLLTRGPASDPSQQVAQNTTKMVNQQSEQIKSLQDLIRQQQRLIDAVKENAIKVEQVRF